MTHESTSISLLKNQAGELIINALFDNDINEIMLNPDGKIWAEHKKDGMDIIGEMKKQAAEAFIRAVAGVQKLEVNEKTPVLETELPIDNSRFEGVLATNTNGGPAFAIRKKAKEIYTFHDYMGAGIMTEKQAKVLCEAMKDRKNILVCGGPGTGKTTFVNACIFELVKFIDPKERLFILEDVPELQCSASNTVPMHTSLALDLSGLLRATLRMRPDRIFIGEVRDKSMLYVLKAWNTGAPGGIATVHANGAEAAALRCSDLAQEANVPPPIALIVETVNVIVAFERVPGFPGRRIKEIVAITGHDGNKFLFKKLA